MVGYHHDPRFFPPLHEINVLHIQPTRNMELRIGDRDVPGTVLPDSSQDTVQQKMITGCRIITGYRIITGHRIITGYRIITG
jgi:hypothetical protein